MSASFIDPLSALYSEEPSSSSSSAHVSSPTHHPATSKWAEDAPTSSSQLLPSSSNPSSPDSPAVSGLGLVSDPLATSSHFESQVLNDSVYDFSGTILGDNQDDPAPPASYREAGGLYYNAGGSNRSLHQESDQGKGKAPMYSSYLDRALNSLRRESFFPPVSTVPGVPTPRPIIQIVEAQKVPEMGGSGHIAYVIQTEIESHRIHHETKHRYSEFEALQKALVRIYPHVVVPSIPEKHALADYAAKQGKAKEDPLMIEKRKRMLQTFLNRIAAHPILGRDEAFHKFLEPGTAWHEALNTAVHAAILRHGNKQKNAIQKLTETRSLRNPDLHFMAAEEYTIKFSNHILHMHKTHKKLSKLLHDLSTTHLELGATYNAWSLQDKELSHGIEHLGAAFDATGTHLGKLSNALEERMTEPLQEYAALSKTIEARLAARHEKHVEFETLTETLHIKQVNLRRLEQSEAEAQRLAAALNAEGTPGHRQYIAPPSLTNGLPDEPVSPTEAARAFGHSGTTPPPPSSMSSSTFSSQRPQGLFATLNSLIDNDPETTRRVAISRNKDRITTLVEQRTGTLRDLNALNVELQEDLDRFQREKIRDLRNLLVGYAVSWRDFHRRESMMWRETGAEVERVKVEDTNSFAGQVFSRTEERGDESAVDWRRMKAPTFT